MGINDLKVMNSPESPNRNGPGVLENPSPPSFSASPQELSLYKNATVLFVPI
jgi:hypothetical protein